MDVAPYLDHAVLDSTATPHEVEVACDMADRYGFAAVCVLPCYVGHAVKCLHRRPIKVATVIGFPLGGTVVKLYEALTAVESGAQELDVVINLGWLRAGLYDAVYTELAALVGETQVPIKAILELPVLNADEQAMAAKLAADAGVAYLKTCTGWRGGATVQDVRFLRKATSLPVKASGGIRTLKQATELIEAGASRLGTSHSAALMQELRDFGDD